MDEALAIKVMHFHIRREEHVSCLVRYYFTNARKMRWSAWIKEHNVIKPASELNAALINYIPISRPVRAYT